MCQRALYCLASAGCPRRGLSSVPTAFPWSGLPPLPKQIIGDRRTVADLHHNYEATRAPPSPRQTIVRTSIDGPQYSIVRLRQEGSPVIHHMWIRCQCFRYAKRRGFHNFVDIHPFLSGKAPSHRQAAGRCSSSRMLDPRPDRTPRGILRGQTADGLPIAGRDPVRIVPSCR